MNALQKFKQKGRILRKWMTQAFNTEVQLGQAYEAVAAMEGCDSWNEFSARLAKRDSVLQVSAAASSALPPVRAILRTVDGKAQAEFDAARWLAQASESDIAGLLDEKPRMAPFGFELSYGGKNGYSDEVAVFAAQTNAEVQAVYTYISALADAGGDCGGSDCYVDAHELQRWFMARAVAVSVQEAVPKRPTGQAPLQPEPELVYDKLQILEVMMADYVDEYEVPDTVPEWQWVQENAAFSHRDNGKVDSGGIWEFMVNVERSESAGDLPEKLKPLFDRARLHKAVWVMFHQGT